MAPAVQPHTMSTTSANPLERPLPPLRTSNMGWTPDFSPSASTTTMTPLMTPGTPQQTVPRNTAAATTTTAAAAGAGPGPGAAVAATDLNDATPISSRLRRPMSRFMTSACGGGGSVEPSSATSDKLRQLAQDIKRRGDQHQILEYHLPNLLAYVNGNAHHREQVVQCGFLPPLLGCVLSAPTRAVRHQVTRLLRELTAGLRSYPTDVEDAHCASLTTSLTLHPDCVIDTLAILSVLTRYPQGRRAAYAANLPRVLARLISALQHREVIVPALDVLCNIAQKHYYGTALGAEVFAAFMRAVGTRLLMHFQKQNFSQLSANPDLLALVWKFAVEDDLKDRQWYLCQLIGQYAYDCSPVFVEWSDVMTLWARLIETCTENELITQEAMRSGLIESANVTLQLSWTECHSQLIRALKNVTGRHKFEYNAIVINVGIIDTLLERFPVKHVWQVFQSEKVADVFPKASAVRQADLETAQNLLVVLSNVLKGLPEQYDKSLFPNNIVRTLIRANINQLCTLQPDPAMASVLARILTDVERLTPGWFIHV